MNENGKKLNLFPQKRKKSKVSNNQAFDMMNTAADKTAVELFPSELDKSTRGIHNALMAAGMTPALGNVADLADAALYALEGELGEAAWSVAAAIPIIGQMVAGKRALKIAKDAGEEMVTLYRGVDKWYPGNMVKKGKFVGSDYGRFNLSTGKDDLPKGTAWVSNNLAEAKIWGKVANKSDAVLGKKGKEVTVLEFEIPKSTFEKMKKITNFRGKSLYDDSDMMVYNYGIFEGIPKEFLKKVHK